MASRWRPIGRSLYDQLTARRLRLGLSGFLKYCSATGIDPWSVSETSVGAFIAYATEVQFTVKPNDLHKQVARCWNRAREAVPGWPLITLTVPDFRPLPASLPWEAFALSFVQDVEHYLSLLGGENLLDEDAPDRACKPSTIKTRRVSEMLERYLSVFRPRLCRVDNPWLFPGEGIAHKTKGTLSGQIIERVIKALGIRVTPHQFRHLAAAFILERDPANYEFVRRVLGHKNLETTIRFYVGLETVDAVRKYSAMALEGHDWRPEQ